MKPPYASVHPRFKLNGHSLGFAELDEVSYSLIKEGTPNERMVGAFLSDWIDQHPTLEVKTSGSTGNPKTITLEKKHMVNSALATGRFFNLKPGDSALLCLSPEFIAGKMMLVRAMVLGLRLDVVPPSSNPLQSTRQSYDFCAMVPMQLQNSLPQINRLEKLIIGGAPMSYQLKKKVYNRNVEVYETYGMTETITHIAIRKVEETFTSKNDGNAFDLLPGITIKKDERDCLVIQAPDVSSNSIVTNDIVAIVSDTQFKWLGRYDNVVNSGGIKLFPEQLEAKLAPSMQQRFFLSGLPDKKLGQRLVLVVEGEVDKVALQEKIKAIKALEKYEIPKQIICVGKFMETNNGKVNRTKTLLSIKSSVP